jgi:hypothetical protein
MYYVLCIMYYVLCIMYYVLCIMYYVLCIINIICMTFIPGSKRTAVPAAMFNLFP